MNKFEVLISTLLLFFSLPANAQNPAEFVQKMQQSFDSIDEQIKKSPNYEKVSKKVLARWGKNKTISCYVRIGDLSGAISELAVKATGSMNTDQAIMSLVRSAAPFKLQTVEAQKLRFFPSLVMIDFVTNETELIVSAHQGHGRTEDDDFWVTEATAHCE